MYTILETRLRLLNLYRMSHLKCQASICQNLYEMKVKQFFVTRDLISPPVQLGTLFGGVGMALTEGPHRILP